MKQILGSIQEKQRMNRNRSKNYKREGDNKRRMLILTNHGLLK